MWLIALGIGLLLLALFVTVIVCSSMNDPRPPREALDTRPIRSKPTSRRTQSKASRSGSLARLEVESEGSRQRLRLALRDAPRALRVGVIPTVNADPQTNAFAHEEAQIAALDSEAECLVTTRRARGRRVPPGSEAR